MMTPERQVVNPFFTGGETISVSYPVGSMTHEQKMMTSEEVAGHLLDAVRHRRRDLVLTSQGKLTVFLNKWFPSLTDKLVLSHFRKEEKGEL